MAENEKVLQNDSSANFKLAPFIAFLCCYGPLIAMDYVKMNKPHLLQHNPSAGQDGAFASVSLCEGGVDEVPNQRVPLKYEAIFIFQPPCFLCICMCVCLCSCFLCARVFCVFVFPVCICVQVCECVCVCICVSDSGWALTGSKSVSSLPSLLVHSYLSCAVDGY